MILNDMKNLHDRILEYTLKLADGNNEQREQRRQLLFFLNSEATTYNIEQVEKLVNRLDQAASVTNSD